LKVRLQPFLFPFLSLFFDATRKSFLIIFLEFYLSFSDLILFLSLSFSLSLLLCVLFFQTFSFLDTKKRLLFLCVFAFCFESSDPWRFFTAKKRQGIKKEKKSNTFSFWVGEEAGNKEQNRFQMTIINTRTIEKKGNAIRFLLFLSFFVLSWGGKFGKTLGERLLYRRLTILLCRALLARADLLGDSLIFSF
jgi:hypothetical protein